MTAGGFPFTLTPPVPQAAPAPDGTVELKQETDAEFAQRVKPKLAEIEVVREDKYRVYCWRRKIGSIAFTLLAPFTGFIDYVLLFTDRITSHGDKHHGGITLALAGALYYWATQPKRDYVRVYKHEIMPRIARVLGLQSYRVAGFIPEADMEPSKIVPSHNRYHSEDYFEGVYKGASVRFAQIRLKQESGSGKDRHETTVFSGLALLVDMPKNKFYGTTIMLRNHMKLFEWFEEKSIGLKRANLVDPAFEKKYTVFTSDQVEARYLLDPMMIEKVQNLAVIYKATDVRLSYFDHKVLVLLACKRDLFEPPDISIPSTDIDGLMELKNEVQRTLELIDCVDNFLSRDDRPGPAAEGQGEGQGQDAQDGG
ncbi:MAG: DUF3137 domain-containing protein [Alphaproteobacteria bacterium]|nr:DUF3137 domain-containing protein [Alphaproteobacteria bacterium]